MNQFNTASVVRTQIWDLSKNYALFSVSGEHVYVAVDNGFTQPLLMNSQEKQQDQDCDDNNDEDVDDNSEEMQKPVNSIVSAYRLLTPSVKVVYLWFFIQ